MNVDLGTLKVATLVLAACIEAAAALIIGLASVEATVRALMLFVPGRISSSGTDLKEVVRLKLGRWLAVALEIELGADILRTAVAPTWNEIGQLGAIIVLRTALNYFLQKEIDKAQGRTGRPNRVE
ncbi:MAG: DUF1622 domain-containing protein [Alphaproteobacteria bacterium]|nr:MAG: DUF1622 domain-containing protein [Alphaproteobacteria bacterium]